MLEELKTFIAVVEEENFTKAAELVNLSQPSVSIHIKNLEAYFGTKLIDRSVKQKKIVITPSGKLLYRRSKELIFLLETTKDELRNESNAPKGHLRIGATLTIGECFLPHLIQIFSEKYPDVEIAVYIGNITEVTAMTKAMRLDVSLIENAFHSDRFKQCYFLEDHLLLIAPKSFGLGDGNHSNESLQNRRWLTREHGSGLRDSLNFFLASHRIVPRSKMIFSTNYALIEGVRNELGIAMISNYMLKELRPDDPIDIISLHDEYTRTFSYILPKDFSISKVAEIFLEELMAYSKTFANH